MENLVVDNEPGPGDELAKLRQELAESQLLARQLKQELAVALVTRDNWRINHHNQVRRARKLTEGLIRYRTALGWTCSFREFMDEWFNENNPEVVEFRRLRKLAFDQDPDPDRKLRRQPV